MTIGSDIAASGPFFPNGVTTAFPFEIDVDSATDISVLWISADGSETVISPGAYGVTISESDPGGTVTFAVAPTIPQAGDELWIVLDPAFEQQDRYSDEGPFNQSLLEGSLDSNARLSIWLRARINRSLRAPFGDALSSLPVASERVGKFLGFDAAGQPVAVDALDGASGALIAALASPNGASLIGKGAASIDDLLPLTPQQYRVFGHSDFNWTPAIEAAIAAVPAGGEIYFPPGTYLMDYITINKRVHIRLSEGATLKNRIPPNPAVTLDANWGIFRFVPGSEGSLVEGGTLDGNRAALAPFYNADTRLGKDNHWWGIRAEFVDDFTCRDVTFRNFFYEAFYQFHGNRCKWLDLTIVDCGVAFFAQGSATPFATGCEVRATCRNIGNVIDGTAYFIFQHGVNIGYFTDSRFDVTFDGFCASGFGVDGENTGGGKEPVPIGINMFLLGKCQLNLSIRNYTTVPEHQSIHQAFNFSSVNDCNLQMQAFGFEQALYMGSSNRNILDVNFDGDYLTVTTAFPREGIVSTNGGVVVANSATLAGEVVSSLSSRDNVIRGVVTRFGIGVRDEGDYNDWSGLSVGGNVTDGIQLVRGSEPASSFPVSRVRESGRRSLVGTRVTANGGSGIIYTGGEGDRIIGAFVRDNGQTFGTRTFPNNITVLAAAGQGQDLQIADNDLDATTSVTLGEEVSFLPGAAVARPALRKYNASTSLTHIFTVLMRNTSKYRVGQIIRLKEVLSGGLDADGKIVDINADFVTIAFAAAVVFSEAGALVNLTGTISSDGFNVTGVGTDFVNEIDFPQFLKVGSEFRKVAFVNNATSLVLDSAFSSNVPAGTSFQAVRADVVTGIVEPAFALTVNENVTAGPMLIRDNVHHNINANINPASFPGIDAGSRWQQEYSLAMAGSALSNTLVFGLPNYTQVSAVEIFNITAVTGVSGNVTIDISDAGSGPLLKRAIGSTLLGFGNRTRGASPDAPAFGAFGGRVIYRSDGGNPTGTVRARLTLEKGLLG